MLRLLKRSSRKAGLPPGTPVHVAEKNWEEKNGFKPHSREITGTMVLRLIEIYHMSFSSCFCHIHIYCSKVENIRPIEY
jgi:hypothetical protein